MVCGANVFGATVQLFSTVLPRFGVEVSYVRRQQAAAWRAAASPRTKLLYCETPSNPLVNSSTLPRSRRWVARSAR